jgi:hypothetical protein
MRIHRQNGPVACLVCRIGRRPASAATPARVRPGVSTEPIEDSTARLIARASAVSTGSPGADRLLAGPGFLDAGALPEISFRSGLLAWVPAGWRAAGRLQVKNAVHELACYLALHLGGTRPDGSPRIVIASRWVIDSRWVTSRWIPGLGRGIVMTCLCSLEPDM